MSPAWAGFAALLLVSAAADAQSQEPGTTFSDTVNVDVAEVEVLVTDRDGKPVSGLTPQDFKIVEDGQPVEVTNLSATSSQPLVLGIFLDEVSLSGPSRNLAVKGLKSFLASTLRPGDRAIIFRYTGSLEMQGEPTGDAAALGALLDRIAGTAPRGMILIQERSSLRSDILQALPPGQERDQGAAMANAALLIDRLRQYGRMRAEAARTTLLAMQQAIALLATLPERKALFVMSGGLPMSPGADLLDLWNDKYQEFASQLGVSPLENVEWDATRLVQDTADRANTAGITLHVLGSPETGAVSASAAGAIGARSGWDPEESDRALQTLAAATGGRVVTEMQNPAPFLEAAGRDIDAGYVLAYTPAMKGKKGRHKLKVTVRDGQLNARHREERIDGAIGDPLLRAALAALWAGAGANPLKADLTVEEQTPEKDGRFRVTAILSLPLASVFVQPQEHFHIAHLTLAIAARDGKGRISGAPRTEFPIEIPNEKLLSAVGQSAGYRFTLYLAPGESLVAIAVRDDGSGVESVLRTSLKAGAEAAAAR
ncbi:MAG TPA: VWA domain-containing protein [Thermoanaerobaculia bacterium]|nr:VWA domain-containing protein [Thermoanaerobaculia bacterium]